MSKPFSIIILTYNEEIHLPRLLQSISKLDAPVYVLDSGSTDGTIEIAKTFGAEILTHAFENHPKQWDYALKNFDIKTLWVICLDADQVVTPELLQLLLNFRDEDYSGIDGIYLNRKNYFKGRWIKHGGYYPFYLLKMIRFGKGYSDLNENMDHRFIVEGKTTIWKDGHLLEENLKENNISFWIDKHNRYSGLVAQEEVERMQNLRSQTLNPRLNGSPDERTAWFKQLWWKLPRYTRPMLYFIYRMFFQLGILDGQTGIIFHFLQAYWFRLIVDIKIEERLKQNAVKPTFKPWKAPLKFVLTFIFLFLVFYYFNIGFFSISNGGNSFWATHFNYIAGLRWLLLSTSAAILHLLGFTAITSQYQLLVAGRGMIELVYTCLGLGVISFFAAFVIAYPKPLKAKLIFLITGILFIELLNIARFVLLVLYWNKSAEQLIDHHTLFNIIIYIIIAISLYFWVKHPTQTNNTNAAN